MQRDAASAGCPDVERMRALLRGRLGRDALDDAATRRATLRFTRTRRQFEALLRIESPRRAPAVRTLRSPAAECTRLGDAVALVLAIAIDPVAALRPPTPAAPAPTPPGPAPTPPPAPAPAPTPSPSPAPAPAPVPAPPPPSATPAPVPRVATSSTPGIQVAALASMTAGLAPGTFADAIRPGLTLRVAARWRRVDLPVELSADAPGTLDDLARRARVTALPVSLGAALCPRFATRPVVTLCGTATLAAVIAWGSGYAPDATDVALGFGLGARVGVEVPLRGRWSFVASAEARGLLVRPALTVSGTAGASLWTAFPVTASLALGVAWSNR